MDESLRKEADPEPLAPPHCRGWTCDSNRYAWIPTNFQIDSRTSARTLSYINNLHPSHAELYDGISELVARFSMLFDRVLTDLHPAYEQQLRVDPSKRTYEWVSHEDDPEPRDYVVPDFEERHRAWEGRRTLLAPTVPAEGYSDLYDPSKRSTRYSILGRTVQVIVKLANIHLVSHIISKQSRDNHPSC